MSNGSESLTVPTKAIIGGRAKTNITCAKTNGMSFLTSGQRDI